MSFDENYCRQIVNSYLKYSNQSDVTIVMENDCDLNQLGSCICGLANLALYKKQPYAYALWGISSAGKKIIGTSFIPPEQTALSSSLSIKAVYSISKFEIEDKSIVVLEVQCAANTTMQYKGVEYIFIDNTLRLLKNFPEIEKKLWDNLDSSKSFELQPAKSNVSAEDIINLLDCKKLFSMLSLPYPDNPSEIIAKLTEFRFITEKNTGKYVITNLGALLLARRLNRFESVEYKAVRVLQYNGIDNTHPAHEQVGGKGYIVGFEGLIEYIISKLPTCEKIEGAIRKNICIYPTLPVRELVANALVHQNFAETGSPIISIFPNYIEITNPGKPLISLNRFIDHPPCSRNEALVAAMRKVGICEERGSGYDKVISCVEKYNLPAPIITEYERSTKVCLFPKKSFDTLSKKEKIDACYAHVCLKYVKNEPANNSTLRARFQLGEDERYKISRVFNDACDAKLIKAKKGTGMKNREYIPFWASDNNI